MSGDCCAPLTHRFRVDAAVSDVEMVHLPSAQVARVEKLAEQCPAMHHAAHLNTAVLHQSDARAPRRLALPRVRQAGVERCLPPLKRLLGRSEHHLCRAVMRLLLQTPLEHTRGHRAALTSPRHGTDSTDCRPPAAGRRPPPAFCCHCHSHRTVRP